MLATDRTLERNTVRIADIDFDLLDSRSILDLIGSNRHEPGSKYITLVNPHSVMLCRRDREMGNAIARAWRNLPDGVGIILGARMLSCPHRGRTSGPELMLELCDRGRRMGLRHYFYGGGDGVAPRMAERLSQLFPGLDVAGVHTPPFRGQGADEDEETIGRINAARPDILWVGLGAPKQEKWMACHAGRLRQMVMVGVGAAFDFHSGNVPWCPKILRRSGLEWAYRVGSDRKRWHRFPRLLKFVRLVLASR